MCDDDKPRSRFAVVVLLLGVILVAVSVMMLWAVAETKPSPERSAGAAQSRVGATVFLRWLAGIATILLIFAVGTLVMLRFSRRFRELLLQQRSPATEVDDLWGKARLPNNEPLGDIPSPRIDPRPRPRRRRGEP